MYALLLSSMLLLQRPVSNTDSASIVGHRLLVEPLGISLEIPADWLPNASAQRRPAHSCVDGPDVRPMVVTARAERAALERPAAGYDVEYAQVVDTLVSFDRMVAHLGADQWGRGHCWNGLSARVYVLPAPDPAIPERAAHVLVRTASGGTAQPAAATIDSAGWRLTRLEWTSPHGDFIGAPRVELLTRELAGRTLVVAFMYMGADALTTRSALLASVRDEGRGPPPRPPPLQLGTRLMTAQGAPPRLVR